VTGSGAAASRNRPDRILDVNTGSWGQYSQVLNNARHSPRRHRTLFYVSCSMIPGAAGFHGDSRNNMTWYIQNDTRFCFWCLAHYRGSDTALEDTHLVTESRVTPSGSAERVPQQICKMPHKPPNTNAPFSPFIIFISEKGNHTRNTNNQRDIHSTLSRSISHSLRRCQRILTRHPNNHTKGPFETMDSGR
jgi:hypothetical protein